MQVNKRYYGGGDGDGGQIQRAQPRSFYQSPKFAFSVVLYLFGLFIVFFATSPFVMTEREARIHESHMTDASNFKTQEYNNILTRIAVLEGELDVVKVWFWRLRPEYAVKVHRLQQQLNQEVHDLDTIVRQRNNMKSEVLKNVGVWSEYGIADARAALWDAYEYGKDIAKRSTWFDVLTTVSSDEGLGAFVLRVALQFLLNFTIGLFIAFFSFLWQLWSLVVLYKTSLLSGLLFVLVAAIGAASLFMIYIVLLFGTVVGGGAALRYLANNSQRLQGQRREQPQRLHED